MILRKFPVAQFQPFQEGGNLFATAIFLLQSAVMKISRVMRIPKGLGLYCGLGGLVELPNSFYEADEHGCLGFMEYGLLSTTSHRDTAVEYSGAGEGKPLPMVIQTCASSIDRGACIKDFSQYPSEVNVDSESSVFTVIRFHSRETNVNDSDIQVEYLFPAGSYVEPIGQSYTVESGKGLLAMVPVHINANIKALTVEDFHTQKKDLHIISFSHLLAETECDLVEISEAECAQIRLENDQSRVFDLQQWLREGGRLDWLLPGMSDGTKVTFNFAGLLYRIGQQCKVVFRRQAALPPEQYNDDEAFRHTVAEMLEIRAAAVGTLRGYIEDPGVPIETVMRSTIMTQHRDYLSFMEKIMPAEGKARVLAAARLCRALGAMQSSVDEADSEGLTPLMRAAAEGAGGRVLRCLVAARSDVNARDATEDRTALYIAAESGHAEAVEALARLGSDPDATSEPEVFDATPIWIAAYQGHTAVIETLGRLGVDENHALKDGRTSVYIAATFGHAAAIEALSKLGADVNKAEKDGWTPLRIAKQNGHAAAADVLQRLGAAS